MSGLQPGDYLNISGIQIATESPFTDNNNKIFTSGRVLQEINNAIINNGYNYVIDSVREITYDSSTATPPARPAATAETPEVIFVHVVDTKVSNPNPPYYELLKKVLNTGDSPAYIYVCNQVPISSIVLDPRDNYQDIYTLYSNTNDYPPPSENEPVPHHYQNWVKTDRFNEDVQINLTHTDTSLTTKGNIQIDGDSKLLIKELSDYHSPADTTTYTEITKTDLTLTSSTTESNITTTKSINITSNEIVSSSPTDNSVISVSYNYEDSNTPANNYTDSVCISSHDELDTNITGASVVLTGENSFVETPILRLKIVE